MPLHCIIIIVLFNIKCKIVAEKKHPFMKMSFNHNKCITICLKLLKVILCLVLTYLSMLAQPLMADYCILPELQLFINEES